MTPELSPDLIIIVGLLALAAIFGLAGVVSILAAPRTRKPRAPEGPRVLFRSTQAGWRDMTPGDHHKIEPSYRKRPRP